MRPKFLLFIAVFVLVMLALLFWRQPKQGDALPKSTPQNGQAIPTMSGGGVAATQKTANAPQIAASAPNQPSRVNDRERTNEIRQYMESQNKPIEFYGKVVDQDGSPLTGAKIAGRVHRIKVIFPAPWGAEDQYIAFKKTTDLDGRFEIRGETGTSFGVVISKDGYEPEIEARSFNPSSGSFDNPVVFKMWSTNIHEQLITGEKSFEIQPDGKAHVIDLAKGAMVENGAGDLKIWIQYTNQVTRGQLYDWSAGIEVVNGGLLEEPYGTVMYSAPADGYTPLFLFQQQIKGGQSGEIGDHSFYLLLKNGQVYGRMSINLFAPYGFLHPGLIRLSYAINPSGSRILR